MLVAQDQILGPSLMMFPGLLSGPRSELEQLQFKQMRIWDPGFAGSGLTYYTTMPVLNVEIADYIIELLRTTQIIRTQ